MYIANPNTFAGTVESSPTFKDDPTAGGETPKYGKTNSTTHKQMVEADVSGTVALDAATLAALETISAVVSGTVALDAPTLAALENIVVSGTVALDSATLAALETITAVVSGTVALDSATLAALENITAVVSGSVSVSNMIPAVETGLAKETTLGSIKDTDGIKKITNALPVGSNQIGATIPNRPSQGTGRTYKTAMLSNQTADATLYTNTGGKTLYVTAISFSAFNTSTTATGIILIKDGGTGGTAKIPILMTPAGVAAQLAASASVQNAILFAEPLQFSTDVFMDITSGTVTYSIMLVGYEE